jgi:hypothetical protein
MFMLGVSIVYDCSIGVCSDIYIYFVFHFNVMQSSCWKKTNTTDDMSVVNMIIYNRWECSKYNTEPALHSSCKYTLTIKR